MRGAFSGSRLFFLLLSLAVAPAAGVQELGAQDLQETVIACSGGVPLLEALCQETALGIQAAQSLLGLAASAGTDVPGSASTMGWRTKGSPRIALSLRGTVVRGPLLDLSMNGWPKDESWDGTVPALNLGGAMGLFDGFSLGPTVGGVGSIDLMASAHWMSPPGDGGFGQDRTGWGVGARLGLLRESFSLPGITLSAFHRSLGTASLWKGGGFAEGEFDLQAVSLRGVAGKDLWGVGFVVGAGWDRYSGDASFRITEFLGRYEGQLSGDFRSHRRLAFLGASLTFLVLQISAEVGLAEGDDFTLAVPRSGGTDPSSRSEFGSLALRLTF